MKLFIVLSLLFGVSQSSFAASCDDGPRIKKLVLEKVNKVIETGLDAISTEGMDESGKRLVLESINEQTEYIFLNDFVHMGAINFETIDKSGRSHRLTAFFEGDDYDCEKIDQIRYNSRGRSSTLLRVKDNSFKAEIPL